MFLSFVGSNVDEFFMVRVAGLKRQIEKGVVESGPDGMTPTEQLRAIRASVIRLNRAAHDCWAKELVPALGGAGLRIERFAELTEDQKAFANTYFQETIFPTLTPLAFDPGRPFPHISNLSLNLAVVLRDALGVEHFARVKIPDSLPQLVPVTVTPKLKSRTKVVVKEQVFVWIEQLVTANLGALFPGMEIVEAHPFHITRDADSDIQDLEAGDLMESVEEGVFQRRFADVVRVEINEAMPASVLEILVTNLELDRDDIYKISGPLSLVRVRGLAKFDRPDLKYPPFVQALPAALLKDDDDDIFASIRRGDILFHHPFDSFQPIVGMLQKAAHDPNVLAIKITLYRVGRNAPVVDALLEAAENGKQIAVLLELKARFDEESNIGWARKLEEYGVHVVYGLLGLKVHCKAALIVRKEGDVIRRYAHLATGNYNAVTAGLYTDVGMLTCDPDIGADCSDLFNFLTGYSAKSKYRKLLVAPNSLRNRFEELLEREIEHQKAGRPAHLILKMNSLVDRKMIQLLYQASQAGVRVDLLVRGICCLRPGIPGVSENIQVTSIVGRFLEHSRIYYFLNGGDEEIYLGSADLMPRNLNRRVEVLFPVQDKALIRVLKDDILGTYMKEQAKARHMQSDGKYVRDPNAGKKNALNSQETFIARASKRLGK
jgi:polyphosphate kinase